MCVNDILSLVALFYDFDDDDDDDDTFSTNSTVCSRELLSLATIKEKQRGIKHQVSTDFVKLRATVLHLSFVILLSYCT
jgi:hypothetical protein